MSAPGRVEGPARAKHKEVFMLGTLLLVFIVLLLLGSLPAWPYSRGWGYYPSGLFGLVLVILIVFVLLGRF